ncbi:unnamed protein product, partial [Iphiclides podalirius]
MPMIPRVTSKGALARCLGDRRSGQHIQGAGDARSVPAAHLPRCAHVGYDGTKQCPEQGEALVPPAQPHVARLHIGAYLELSESCHGHIMPESVGNKLRNPPANSPKRGRRDEFGTPQTEVELSFML